MSLNGIEYPVIRIQRITIDNFKSVSHGEIYTACGKRNVPMGTQSDILGIYGQNGSGKTSLIEAISILKYLLMGESIPDEYADCIMVGKKEAHIECEFDFQYKTKASCRVIYEVIIGLRQEESGEDDYFIGGIDSDNMGFRPSTRYLIKVESEIIKVAGNFEGGRKLQAIIDTTQGEPFGPTSKHKYFIKDTQDIYTLKANKEVAKEHSQSAIFMERNINVFNRSSSDYIDVINNLQRYATSYLFVVDTKSSGLIRLNTTMPIVIRRRIDSETIEKYRINLKLKGPSILTEEKYKEIKAVINNIDVVLNKLIPGLIIDLKDLGPILLPNTNIIGKRAELIAIRNGVEIPFRDESDGVKKLISTLQLYIEAYNDPSLTIAIDEFDAGIFEYLLGEMLSIFEESGKGQFIFSSHNLRPLEVLNKNYICFTTTDPENRYTRLDYIKPNNNLRNVYFREIELGGESEELYINEKKYKIIQALRKAGQADYDKEN